MLKEDLKKIIQKTISLSFLGHEEGLVEIEYPSDPVHGDYSCNSALRLAKKVGKSPREVAEIIVENLGKPEFLQTIEIAGPGFINFFVAPDYLVGNLRGILSRGDKYGTNSNGQGKKIVVEYSSPNTNKPLHLGHARNNFLGMAVANLLKANGFEVETTQNVNDRGVHICKSMLAYQEWGRDTSPESIAKKGDHFVGDYYVKYALEEKNNASLEEKVNEMLKKWEENDPKTRALWEKMNNWVYDGFNQTYDLIGSRFTYTTYESDFSEGGRSLVEEAHKKGIVEKIEGGALAIDLADCKLGDPETGKKVLVRSNGTTIYITQDIKLAVERMKKTKADSVIYVVGNEQDYHFKVLFEILKRFGYEWAERLYHLSYAMVTLPSGKMKSREGTTVDLDNLVAELKELVDKEITDRNLPYEGKERVNLIRAVALGALKYFILKIDPKADMMYDPKASIDFQGNTGPYIQYTYARIQSILRRTEDSEKLLNLAVAMTDLGEPEEISIMRKLQLFPEVIYNAGQDYRIHGLVNYLYDLAQETNGFYVKHRVLEAGTPQKRLARLQLIAAVAQVLKNGLKILGIEAPERM